MKESESESEVTRSCPTLGNPMNCRVHGILQARIPEWIAFPFSRGSSQPKESNQGLLHCRQILYQLSYSQLHEVLPNVLKQLYSNKMAPIVLFPSSQLPAAAPSSNLTATPSLIADRTNLPRFSPPHAHSCFSCFFS